MTILITGATGKVGKSLVKVLHAANAPILLATRSGTAEAPFKAVKFDWLDESTYSAPFEVDVDIDKVFLIQPAIFDPLVYMKPFVELAITKGVKRFVYVSSSALEKGDVVNGKVHEYLADRGVDYVILRPTTFAENFSTIYYRSLRENNEIFSACGDGKVAYVSVDDIALAARDALLAEKTLNNDIIIVGPKSYSHDEIAALLSEILGRKITHRKLTSEEFHKLLQNFGMEEKYAGMLVYIHEQIAAGNEEAVTRTPGVYVGKRSLPEYFEEQKGLWVKT